MGRFDRVVRGVDSVCECVYLLCLAWPGVRVLGLATIYGYQRLESQVQDVQDPSVHRCFQGYFENAPLI